MVAIVELELGEGLVATGQGGGNEATAQHKRYSAVTCAPCNIASNRKPVRVLHSATSIVFRDMMVSITERGPRKTIH